MTQLPASSVVSLVDGRAVTTTQNIAAVFINRHGLPCLDYRQRGLFAVRLRGGYPRTYATQAGIDWLRQEYATGVRS